MTLPTVPDFSSLLLALFGSVVSASLILLLFMAQRSWNSFGSCQISSMFRALARGRLAARSFFAILTVQFVISGAFLYGLNEVRYVENDLGLGAYTSHNTTLFDVHATMIPICGWRDRFPIERLFAIIHGEDVPLRDPNFIVPTDDPRIDEFNVFMEDLEEQFRSQAPGAIHTLTERLNPVFAILSGLFLIAARSLVHNTVHGGSYSMLSAIGGGVLAISFVMLGYFVILGYHSSTEVASAIAAGRVLCTAHVAPFFGAQVSSLVAATSSLLLLLVLSPRAILTRL